MSVLALAAAWFAAIMMPGPDLFQIMRLGVRDRHAGVMCALGIMLGNTVWIIGSLVGLSAAIAARPGVLLAIQIIGGSYITWIGISSLWSGFQRDGKSHVVGSPVEPRMQGTTEHSAGKPAESMQQLSRAAAFRIGILTNLSNPKAVVFFASIFAQFIRPDLGLWWSVFMAIFLIITGLGWFIGFAFGVRALGQKILTNAKVIDVGAGIIFSLIGGYMVVAGIISA